MGRRGKKPALSLLSKEEVHVMRRACFSTFWSRPFAVATVVLLAIFALSGQVAHAAPPTPTGEWRPPAPLDASGVVKVGNFGSIDWAAMQVVAVGTGVPPATAQNPSLAKAMASRASLLDARRNLLEVVKEVAIDSETRVVDFMTQSDVVVNRISGVLQAARVDSVRQLPDGAYETKVSMPLAGALGEELTRLPERVKAPAASESQPSAPPPLVKTTPAKPAPRPAPASAEVPLAPAPPAPPTAPAVATPQVAAVAAPQVPGGGYTGLVVDARGLGFKPSLKPELYGPSGLLYPGPNVDTAATAKRGFVRFYRNLDQAQQSKLVGGLPNTVKAVGLVDGKAGSLQLEPAAAESLKLLLATPSNFLDAGNVVVVF